MTSVNGFDTFPIIVNVPRTWVAEMSVATGQQQHVPHSLQTQDTA